MLGFNSFVLKLLFNKHTVWNSTCLREIALVVAHCIFIADTHIKPNTTNKCQKCTKVFFKCLFWQNLLVLQTTARFMKRSSNCKTNGLIKKRVRVWRSRCLKEGRVCSCSASKVKVVLSQTGNLGGTMLWVIAATQPNKENSEIVEIVD